MNPSVRVRLPWAYLFPDRSIGQDTYKGDPAEPVSQNSYAYAHNDPVNTIDPSGHWAIVVGAVIGGVVKGVLYAATHRGENFSWSGLARAVGTGALFGASLAISPHRLVSAVAGVAVGVTDTMLTGRINTFYDLVDAATSPSAALGALVPGSSPGAAMMKSAEAVTVELTEQVLLSAWKHRRKVAAAGAAVVEAIAAWNPSYSSSQARSGSSGIVIKSRYALVRTAFPWKKCVKGGVEEPGGVRPLPWQQG